MTEITSSSSRRKAPYLDSEDFACWEMIFKIYCSYRKWKLFYADESEVDEDELEALRTTKISPLREKNQI